MKKIMFALAFLFAGGLVFGAASSAQAVTASPLTSVDVAKGSAVEQVRDYRRWDRRRHWNRRWNHRRSWRHRNYRRHRVCWWKHYRHRRPRRVCVWRW